MKKLRSIEEALAEDDEVAPSPPAANGRSCDEVMAAFGGPPKEKKRSRPAMSDAKLLGAFEELERLVAEGRLAEARPIHFVALYADLYARVYGVMPVDLGPRDRVPAVSMAKSMLEKDFGGSAVDMADFLSWTWTREKGRVARNRESERETKPIAWRLQFGRWMLADYRVAKSTKKREAR